MNIYFSENLKRFRSERNLTQEALADFLGVSFQAISKWERGENYPDIEMLINLAGFFNTSVDHLLGVNKIENEQKILKIIEQIDNLTDEEMIKKLLADALKEFPTDFRLQLRQMAALAFYNNGKDFKENFPKIKAIYDNIQNNCTVDTIRICSKRYLAMYYNTLSYYEGSGINHKDCEKIVEEMPYMRDGKEFLASYLYPAGDYESEYIREALEEEIGLLCHGICHRMGAFIDDSIPIDSRIKAVKFQLQILNGFYNDSNYGRAWRLTIYSYGHLGHMYFEKGDKDKAYEYLKKTALLAKKFDNMDRITEMNSDFFKGRKFDKHTLGSTYIASSHIKRLMTENYPLTDEFKQSKEFLEIMDILDK